MILMIFEPQVVVHNVPVPSESDHLTQNQDSQT